MYVYSVAHNFYIGLRSTCIFMMRIQLVFHAVLIRDCSKRGVYEMEQKAIPQICESWMSPWIIDQEYDYYRYTYILYTEDSNLSIFS